MSNQTQTSKSNTAVFAVAPFDTYAERISTGIALLGGVLMLPVLFWFLSGIRAGFGVVVVPVAIAAALVVLLLLNYAVQPTSYRIESKELVIKRRWSRAMRIPLKDITGSSGAAALADVPRVGLRRAYNAGIFGYQGPFRLEPYGMVFFVATNRERLVAVARAEKPPLILSPERPREFVEALREAMVARATQEMREQ